MISFLQTMVRQPSLLGNELGAQQVVYRKLKSMGLETEIWEPRIDLLRTHPAFASVEWSYEKRPNVTATLKAVGDGSKSLVLNGHIDVVSPEPLWGWTYDPWGAEIVGRRLYGRGSLDMKGGIAMSVLALEAIIGAGVGLRGNVYVESVLEEECTGNGSLACRLHGYSSDATGAIIPEPLGLNAGVSDMGVMWFRVVVRGSSGHVFEAHKANNAIEKCFYLIQGLKELEKRMNEEISHPAYLEKEHPINMNVGIIKGGDWPSTVPGECSFDCRLSFEPGVRYMDIRQRVEDCVKKAAEKDPWLCQFPPKIEYYGFQAEGSEVDVNSEFVQSLTSAHRKVTDKQLTYVVDTGLTDMRYFNLYSDTPAVSYGPIGANEHNADEYVELDSIVTGAKTVALLILDWCGYLDS